MNRNEVRALYVAVPALAMSTLLLEVLAFRTSAAVLGGDAAGLVAFLLAGAAGVGAAVLTRVREESRAVLARRAAHLAAIAGGATLVSAVGFSWVGDVVARSPDDVNAVHGAIALIVWLAPALFAGGALATTVRVGMTQLGRVGWAEAMGAAATCLLLSMLLQMGGPRAVLATALPFAAAALALGYLARSARPSWGALVTLPLAVAVLLLGDIGAPWLRIPADVGAQPETERLWTPQGVIALRAPKSTQAYVTLDQSPEFFVAELKPDPKRARFAVQDLVYLTNESARGPALVIGSAGGRELALSLARGHEPLDGIAFQGALVNGRLSERYAQLTGSLLADDRLKLTIGDGRAALAKLPRAHYQRIIVLGESRPVQIGPRLLMRHDRLFTLAAVEEYIAALRPGGTLVLQVPRATLANSFATARSALGGAPDAANAHLMACKTRLDWVALVVHSQPLTEKERRTLMERCKRSMVVEEPASPELSTGTVAQDERPFLGTEDGSALAALGSLVPDSEKNKAPAPKQTSVATAAAWVLAPALLLVALWRPRTRPLPRALELSLAPFGVALALCGFALVDAFVTRLGNPAYAWSLLIPMTLVGMGAGRLWIDVDASTRAARPALLACGGWLVLVMVLVHTLVDAVSIPVAIGLSLPLLAITSAALGAPLYAILRMMREQHGAGIERGIAIHQLGWALGGSMAVLVAHGRGLAWVLPAGVVAFLLAAALAWRALPSR